MLTTRHVSSRLMPCIHGNKAIDVATEEGARLLCAAEFQTHAEVASIIRIAKRQMIPAIATEASKLVIVYGNGSISVLDSLHPEAYKRLYLLQGQIIRNTRHFASLNPRSHRSALPLKATLYRADKFQGNLGQSAWSWGTEGDT